MQLTTLANVKTFAISTVPSATQSTADDTLLNSLINQASMAITNYIQRSNIARTAYVDQISGAGNEVITLKNWPVVSVQSVVTPVVSIPARPSPAYSGFYLGTQDGSIAGRPQQVFVQGYCFPRGQGNVTVNYQAGYCIQNEAATVPGGSYTLVVQQPYGSWCQDDGVTYANGTALTPVTGVPTAGQYTVAAGAYTFAAADTTAAVLISYSYIPFDIEQVCIELAVERYQYKKHVGMKSVGAAQSTTTYDNSGLNQYSKMLLNPYRKAFPL